VRHGTPAPLAVATIVLALLTSAATVCVGWLWAPIDSGLLTSADEANWDTSRLLPHQDLLWLAINGGAALSLGLTVVAYLAMRASRAGR
jgi:hypothetical protein